VQADSNDPGHSLVDAAISSPVVSAPKVFIKELAEKQTIQSYFLVRDKALLTGKNGKAYISLFLSDSTGSIDSRIWDNVDAYAHAFQSGDVVKVKGQVQLFQNRRQFVVHKLEKALPGEFDMSEMINQSQRSPEEMFQQLMLIVEAIPDRNIKQLILDTLTDPEIRPLILKTPAAKTIHHAYYGGLLEHVLSICGLMKFIAGHYPDLNLSYLIFGAIFHDIGKIWELEIDNGITYTDKGKLLGHMVLAVELVEKKASRILGFPDELKTACKHIILSHHGKIEYGSPKTPMFLEAFIVAAIDDLDSKINTIQTFIHSERETGERWSKYNQLFDRYFFLKP
jgi:3'-5' exoribonuclease